MHTSAPRVAVCMAGALRDFQATWVSLELNVVEPANASVYLVMANTLWPHSDGSRSHAKSDAEHMTPELLLHVIGRRLRGGAVWNGSHLLTSSIGKWAGTAASKTAVGVHYQYTYFLKRWACNRLMEQDIEGGPYDIVVAMRPDLLFFQPWRFTMHGHAQGRSLFSLRVGSDSSVDFGMDELVVHAFTMYCFNDWLSISSARAFTTLAQLIHHLHSASAFMPCASHTQPVHGVHGIAGAFNNGGEMLTSSYLWRAGIAHKLHPDHCALKSRDDTNPNLRTC